MRAILVKNREVYKKAEQEVLRALVGLSKQTDADVYFSPATIADNTALDEKYGIRYGLLTGPEISELLSPFVDGGYVRRIRLTKSIWKNRHMQGYRVNEDRIDELVREYGLE
jgi:hypothetical protein